MSSYLILNGRAEQRPVRNLGWLLRHWSDVKEFSVYELRDDPTKTHAVAHVVVRMKDGGKVHSYCTTFASLSVLKEWLDRPVFRGLRVFWVHRWNVLESLEIGSPDYRNMDPNVRRMA